MTPEQELKVQIFDILQQQADIGVQQQKLESEKAQLEQDKNALLRKLEKLKADAKENSTGAQ